LSLVLVHAHVSTIAKPLVNRTLTALIDELAKEAFQCFGQVKQFGMGGMLQVREREEGVCSKLLGSNFFLFVV
jgi:Exocyst complex component Sec5